MTATERREEIMKILVARRYETMSVLAAELGVTTRTIRSDILKLTSEYPLETTRGNGGGVSVPNDYHPYKNKLSLEQIKVLEQLMETADEYQSEVVRQILAEFSYLPYRQKHSKKEVNP